jgi:hypothetical protein
MNQGCTAAESDDVELRRLYDYWNERRGKRAFPAVSDIDVIDFPSALGRISVVELVPGKKRFRYRLVASQLTNHLGYEMSSRYVEDIPEPEVRAYMTELYERAAATGEAQHDKGERLLDGRLWRQEALVLPLGESDDTVDLLLIYRRSARPRIRQASRLALPQYLSALIDAAGTIRRIEAFAAADDAQATEAGKRLLRAAPEYANTEIWSGRRRVAGLSRAQLEPELRDGPS